MIKKFSRVMVVIVVASFFGQVGTSQSPVQTPAADKWQPTRNLPMVVVAKYDDQKPKVLLVNVPSIVYQTMPYTYMADDTPAPIPAPVSSQQASAKVVPVATTAPKKKVERISLDLIETFGPVEKKEIPLEGISFFDVNGVEIPKDQALIRLKTASHLFYGSVPDLYFRSVVNSNMMVVKGKKLPPPSTKYPW